MPAFRYEAVDVGGATRKGVVNADNARSARADLRGQGLTPLTVDAIAAQGTGMKTMREDGQRWLDNGTTTQAELLRVTKD